VILPHRVADLDEQLRERLADVADWRPTELRRAAVLLPIVAHGAGAADHVLFCVRHQGTHRHAGQIAFPGGMRDGDESPLQTALRETREEVGVAAAHVDVLGELPPHESSTGIFVHCLVARLQPVPLVPEEREVARLLHMPLADLLDDANWQHRAPPHPYRSPPGMPATSPQFEFGDELLWGLTARFVRDLAKHLRGER